MERCLRIGAAAVILALSMTSGWPAAVAAETQRPIEDWLDAQGSMTAADWEAFFVDAGFPLEFGVNYVVWSGRDGPMAPLDRVIWVDYAGLSGAGLSLPTELSGSVSESTLADGRTEVHVSLHTADALTWVTSFDVSQFGDGDLDAHADVWPAVLFGATPSEVAGGADPVLGDSFLTVAYRVDRAPGEPMEDLIEVAFAGGGELLFVSFYATADGYFRQASGFGEGTSGRAFVQQTGLILPGTHNLFRGALGDAFPAEWIRLREVGR